jgi:hypothetical protein
MRLYTLFVAVACVVALHSGAVAQTPARPANPRQHTMEATDANSTLRHLMIRQELFKGTHGRYSSSADSIALKRPEGVSVRIVVASSGYAAVSTSATQECAVFRGNARPARPYARTVDQIRCVARPAAGIRQN